MGEQGEKQEGEQAGPDDPVDELGLWMAERLVALDPAEGVLIRWEIEKIYARLGDARAMRRLVLHATRIRPLLEAALGREALARMDPEEPRH